MEGLGKVVSKSFLSQLYDKQKEVRNHLISQNRVLLQGKAIDIEKLIGIGIKANNDIYESSFRSLTENIKKSLMISLPHAGSITMVKLNGDFELPLVYAKKKEESMP